MTLVPLLLVLVVLLYPAFWLVYQLRRYYRLRSRGFWVARHGRDDIVYEERRAGATQQLIIHGEMMARGPHLIYVPNEVGWVKEMPEWAQDRRVQILENIQRALGTKNYEYYSS